MFSRKRSGNSIQIEPLGRRASFEARQTVLEVACAHGVELAHSCGGMGICGTCLIKVESDPAALPARGEIEAELAGARGFADHERLACQLRALNGLIVRIPSGPDQST